MKKFRFKSALACFACTISTLGAVCTVGIVCLALCSCAGKETSVPVTAADMPVDADFSAAALPASLTLDTDSLDALAEFERSGGFETGQGFRESLIREQGGDYAGAVLAVFKELYWAFNLAQGEEQIAAFKKSIETGFGALPDSMPAEFLQAAGSGAKPRIDAAVNASLAFFRGDYHEADVLLESLLAESFIEPDAFASWMHLVCALETNAAGAAENDLRALRSTYAAIRSRYETLSAYWYFGARRAKGEDIPSYAERAINLSPRGPFANSAREMIAVFVGLPPNDGKAIMTKYEIENTVTNAVNLGEPSRLAPLFPLLALPDNPYTLYAAGALRGLSENKQFQTFFANQLKEMQSAKNNGRLSERLNFIARG